MHSYLFRCRDCHSCDGCQGLKQAISQLAGVSYDSDPAVFVLSVWPCLLCPLSVSRNSQGPAVVGIRISQVSEYQWCPVIRQETEWLCCNAPPCMNEVQKWVGNLSMPLLWLPVHCACLVPQPHELSSSVTDRLARFTSPVWYAWGPWGPCRVWQETQETDKIHQNSKMSRGLPVKFAMV